MNTPLPRRTDNMAMDMFKGFLLCITTHPLSGSRAISLGSSNPKESKRCWLFPAKSDIDIVSDVASVQYNSDVLHCTANPSQTPVLLMIVVMPDPSMSERLMLPSDTSLQNM